jgi:excisionase family DNA binding protein
MNTMSSKQLEPLINAVDAAKYLGFAPLTVRRMARSGRIPSIAFPVGNAGKHLHKFRMSDLETYVKSLEYQMPVPAIKEAPQSDQPSDSL